MFTINHKVRVLDFANVRRTPGYSNKDGWDVLGSVQPGQTLAVASGPHQADGLNWYELDFSDHRGFVAEGQNGSTILVADTGAAPVCGIMLTRPVHASICVSQNWGENPDYYVQIQGYEVPLRGHNGRDYAATEGSSVVACDDGVVERADMDPWGFGNICVIRHSWGKSYYAHLSGFDTSVGTPVRRGQHIARSGKTGLGMGVGGAGQDHLHFSIKIDGQDDRSNGWGGFTDPTPYMDNPD